MIGALKADLKNGNVKYPCITYVSFIPYFSLLVFGILVTLVL